MEGIEILMISPNNGIPTSETLYHQSTYPGFEKWEWYCASEKLSGPQLLSWSNGEVYSCHKKSLVFGYEQSVRDT